MYFIYNLLAVCVLILAVPVLAYRLIREEGFSERLRQSFGFLPADTLTKVADKNAIWLHAASVGEIVATSPIVKEIRREMPQATIMISVVTASGYVMAKRIIPEADGIIFFPLDIPRLSYMVVRKIRPMVFLLVETELWPNFLKAARNLGIPVMMVNGRISDKSLKRYTYLFGVLKDMLNTVVKYCMQSTIDAQYIIQLGADPRRVVVTGNTKFDQNYTEISPAEREVLRRELGLADDRRVIVAGSTHKGEEELLLTSFEQIRIKFPGTALILAPREILRADELIDIAAKFGFTARRRTLMKEKPELTGGCDVIVIDTIGELGKIYGLGDIIYVGGSLAATGGHNILEPAAHGKPIIVGPHMFNFKDTYALLSGRGACETVYDNAGLTEKILELLENPAMREEMGRQALNIIRENQGAARESARHLKELLETKS
ncbi:MAG TPA: 3-deoxy-D-manno-octulosonic acid transferase [Methylomusa anaerophila]|uniref:3-deoxy-D-manno-octulosonic acid transferase n=1 Tax=Methylomusa anaerophila TaxID=1930071 RepID=A0A348AKH3_9FIRM|nr:3-deoxy-D-manno-octulosonic acid transferase [Methylomusa anaerophila]BBB91571.1 3-deoxy-D-manno-octulosonic acid transferase [Methylomusa anaerophila]HML89491.1 3-deoxy-D-manno-octulosonic acid transferase [Methylomusa anaerophila]